MGNEKDHAISRRDLRGERPWVLRYANAHNLLSSDTFLRAPEQQPRPLQIFAGKVERGRITYPGHSERGTAAGFLMPRRQICADCARKRSLCWIACALLQWKRGWAGALPEATDGTRKETLPDDCSA